MNRKTLLSIFFLSVAAIAITLFPYASYFGDISSNHERWGQFGDYVGGLLNPFFALTAFLAALYAVYLQGKEIKRSEERSQKDALARDILAVMSQINLRVKSLLETRVGVVVTDTPHKQMLELNFNHMLSEAQRIARGGERSQGFNDFVKTGKSAGTTTEATVRELLELTLQMKSFVAEFESSAFQSRSPFLAYYAGDMAHLCILLQHFDLTNATQDYFKAIVGRHRGHS